MVHFRRRRDERLDRLSVRPLRGRRVLVTYPDGVRRLHAFADEGALARGVARLQTVLTADGWQPIRYPAPRHPAGRGRGGWTDTAR